MNLLAFFFSSSYCHTNVATFQTCNVEYSKRMILFYRQMSSATAALNAAAMTNYTDFVVDDNTASLFIFLFFRYGIGFLSPEEMTQFAPTEFLVLIGKGAFLMKTTGWGHWVCLRVPYGPDTFYWTVGKP